MLTDNQKSQIDEVALIVEMAYLHEGSGHDWQHIHRVYRTAEKLARQANADILVVSLAALLHDADDRKVTGDNSTEEHMPTARYIMSCANLDPTLIEVVCDTIRTIGYHKSLKGLHPETLEAKIVSDADQLDAIGSIGIARTFVYGASRQRSMFEPNRLPMTDFTAVEYDKNEGHTVSHFFEKLLKLSGHMYTDAGNAEAERRQRRMVDFLEGFFEETNAPEEWLQLLDKYRIPNKHNAPENQIASSV